MAGILDSKQRFVDTVMTAEGRRQLVSGEFKIEFATFTDADIFYGKDAVSGTIDLSSIIQLEAPSSLPSDIVTLETNMFGELVAEIVPGLSSSQGGAVTLRDGRIIELNTHVTGTGSRQVVSGSEYQKLSQFVMNSSLKNFKGMDAIGTIDPALDDQDMKISQNSATFTITNKNLNAICSLPVADITQDAESTYQDRRLSHLPNYQYLPPRNKKSAANPRGSLLFNYPNNKQADIITREEYENIVKFLPNAVIEFTNTSRENNLVCQMFDTSGEFLSQLKAIDFGEFVTDDPDHPIKRVYFIGKLYPTSTDKNKTLTFANMFTVEFD